MKWCSMMNLLHFFFPMLHFRCDLYMTRTTFLRVLKTMRRNFYFFSPILVMPTGKMGQHGIMYPISETQNQIYSWNFMLRTTTTVQGQLRLIIARSWERKRRKNIMYTILFPILFLFSAVGRY